MFTPFSSLRTAITLFALLFLMLSCTKRTAETDEATIITVTGPIPASEMGTTLTHEHILVDFIGADSTGYHRWNRDSVMEKVIPYLEEIKAHGVNTFIDCTPEYIGRDPYLLKAISEKTGMNILTNTGYYGAVSNKFIPESFYIKSAEEIAELWINEYKNGIDGSGVIPGFIKIGVDRNDTLSEAHRKIAHAAAVTNLETGLAIASHTGPDAPAFEQIEIMKEHGVDLSSFIWVHAQRGSDEGILKAAEMGVWISLDGLNVDRKREPGAPMSVEWYADRIDMLKEKGLLDKVLISHDAGWYSPGEPNGGNFRSYTGIFTHLLPALQEHGFTQEDIDQLLVYNPSKAFAIK